ncbi:S53 family peptidase [Amycolatopsis sp. PS_44_ISF1]|uniref:S53 family peptidase n=1 Tax=Amycolatopsis sp. PS_44_ISF1 TaxID=2974917 RepID=UPI0028DD7D9A|nr:S53 family peptidase [Amycolatopsis sp. PS_44_ISF1]MDT8912730.1 S53 family peptidase [Amycolatopsis sp. PS_44_ISF1]
MAAQLGKIPRTRRTLALAVGAATALSLCSAGVPAVAASVGKHHEFSPAVSLLAGARSAPERAALTDRALAASGNSLQTAYDTKPLYNQGIDGTGTTLATVVSYGDKDIKSYIDSYSRSHGLPAADVQILEPAGPVPSCDDPGTPADCSSWGGETDLDVAMFHTLAPKAKILVVATPTSETQGIDGFPDMMKAIDYLADHHSANVISMSLGTPEDDFDSSAQLHGLDAHFKKATDAGITVTASTGDDGSTGKKKDDSPWGKKVVSFPAANSYVTAVGGTVLHLNSNGTRTSPDTVWPESGGGVSHEYPAPDWQAAVDQSTKATGRSLPDISLLGTSGTSQSSPLFAAVVALASQKAGKGLGFINPALYRIGSGATANGIVDVTSGSNASGGVAGYQAGKGFDIVSGWGTLDAAKFVPALVRQIG